MRKKAKKPYNKPRIGEVKLVPEEAVLSYCKVSVAGPAKGAGTGCKLACASVFGS